MEDTISIKEYFLDLFRSFDLDKKKIHEQLIKAVPFGDKNLPKLMDNTKLIKGKKTKGKNIINLLINLYIL